MKRIVGSFVCAAFLIGLAGCDSGTGGGAGLPQDMTPSVPVNPPKADMSAGKVNVNKLPKGSETGEAAPTKK